MPIDANMITNTKITNATIAKVSFFSFVMRKLLRDKYVNYTILTPGKKAIGLSIDVIIDIISFGLIIKIQVSIFKLNIKVPISN